MNRTFAHLESPHGQAPVHVSYEAGTHLHSTTKGLAGINCVVALGANEKGRWGSPLATLCRSLIILEQNGVSIVTPSHFYRTLPHAGAGLMPKFYNAVVVTRTDHALGTLLRLLKRIEWMAGRRVRQRWSARPLDLDLIDYGGRVLNWPSLTRLGGPLVLPHPLMHRRGFVLVPLAEAAPCWRHPVLGLTARDLLKRYPELRRGIAPVDSPAQPWH